MLVEVDTGREVAASEDVSTASWMIPAWKNKLEPDWALQHPRDYLDVLVETIQAVLKDTGIR